MQDKDRQKIQNPKISPRFRQILLHLSYTGVFCLLYHCCRSEGGGGRGVRYRFFVRHADYKAVSAFSQASPLSGGLSYRQAGAYWRPPGNPSSGVPFVCPAPRKKPALRAPAFPYAGMPPGSVSCLLSYSISHVAPECSSSSTERILLCALTFSTCRATSRS